MKVERDRVAVTAIAQQWQNASSCAQQDWESPIPRVGICFATVGLKKWGLTPPGPFLAFWGEYPRW